VEGSSAKLTAGRESHGWIGYAADRHGRPNAEGNDHLAPEERVELTRRAEERAQPCGAHQAIVIVDVYENGETVPYVQLPADSKLDLENREAINEVVVLAATALHSGR